MGTNAQTAAIALALDIVTLLAVAPWESKFPMQDKSYGGHQGFKKVFCVTAILVFSLAPEAMHPCFPCCKTEVFFKGVNRDFEIHLRGTTPEVEAGFSVYCSTRQYAHN